jgi:predicted nucleic acid-binding protein
MSNIAFRHPCIVLDADCTISLEASGQVEAILASVPCTFAITKYVYQHEILRANLQALIVGQALTIVELESKEQNTLINLAAAGLDNGEATAGAVAIHRNWAVGIDDGGARKHLAKYYPHIQLISVVDLVKHWTDTVNPSLSHVKAALKAIEDQGGYTPGPRHPLFSWWRRYC